MRGGDGELLDDLRRRVAARFAAGDYDLPWLDAEVVPREPLTPVDRFLQTPTEAAPIRPREIAGRTRARRRAITHQRLRDALAWLALALRAEQHARESVAAAATDHARALAMARRRLGQRIDELERSIKYIGARAEDERRGGASRALRDRYPDLGEPGGPLGLADAEARVFSEGGEDGIVLHLFSLIGATDRRFVEIGVEDGRGSNTANLALTFGWSGTMVARDPAGASAARRLQAEHPRIRQIVSVVESDIASVDELLAEAAPGGAIDLLSILDGDGVGVWQAVARASPRIVVITHGGGAADAGRRTAPATLADLGTRKGYVLAGHDGSGRSAFFVRSDCAAAAGIGAAAREEAP